MLARAQRLLLLAWLCAVAGWLAWFLAVGRPGLAWTGAAVLAGLHAIALALEFLLLPWINARDPAPPATAIQRMRAWWSEVKVAALVFGWRQPFCSRLEPDYLPGGCAGRRGLLLVHGFVCNRGVWNPWMRRLRALEIPFVAIDLEPVLGPIDGYGPAIEAAVSRLERATGLAPVVVAHSMGGLAVRAWLNAARDDTRLHHVVTVGSPHNGTWMARFGLVHNAREMRQDGPWLKALEAGESATRRGRFTCFFSHCDNIVLPASTATLRGAQNIHLAGQAHVQMLYHEEVFSQTLGRLSLPSSCSIGVLAR